MMISDEVWDAYIAAMRTINEIAASKMLKYLTTHEWDASYEARQATIDYAYALVQKYGDASSTLACEMYDIIAEAEGVVLDPALPAQTAGIGEVAKAINGTAKTGNIEIMAGAIGRIVKLAAADTTLQNALRDGAEWAWIPRGDTCAFCLTLASRGWQKASKKALREGHAEHIHANCDCMYAVRMNSDTNVQGYDPDKYIRMYYGADLDGERATPKNRINAMRRKFYQENKEEINAQKRDAYEKRKELNASSAEEMDI